MAVTVKHLNGDASFLLSLEPVLPTSISAVGTRPFRILLDPWITGPSKIFHPKISISTHKEPPCVSSLRDLPEPDLVIISQHKSDHCHEATLRQLPGSGTKTVILAEPASARLIKSWKYFDKDKVRSIPKWEDPRVTGRQSVVRISVPPLVPCGEMGEITIAFIPQKRDISGLHGAIGITYRPPPAPSISPASPLASPENGPQRSAAPKVGAAVALLTPPASPKARRSYGQLASIFRSSSAQQPYPAPGGPPTPTSPILSLRSVRSASSLPLSPLSPASYLTAHSTMTNYQTHIPTSPSPYSSERTLSVLFSPHGISYPSLHAYATSHLVTEGALPLTALLHCFDSVSNPWWLGGNILLGAPAGAETATRLYARTWISAHDGEKDVKGLATGMLRTRKWGREEVEDVVSPGVPPAAAKEPRQSGKPDDVWGLASMAGSSGWKGTEVLALASGEEVVLTSDGVWNVTAQADGDEKGVLNGIAKGAQPPEKLDLSPRTVLTATIPAPGLVPVVE